MTDYERLVDRYVAMWNEGDAGRRRQAIVELWAPDGLPAHQRGEWRGHQAMEERVTGSWEKSVRDGGNVFVSAGNVEGYRNVLRFNWHMKRAASGATAAKGFELLTLAEDGRIAADYQFIDPMPT